MLPHMYDADRSWRKYDISFWYFFLLMILFTGCCDAWWRAVRQQSLAGGLGASLCALRRGCVCSLVYEDPTEWSGPHICGLLWFKGFLSTSFAKSSLSASQCKHFFSVLLYFFSGVTLSFMCDVNLVLWTNIYWQATHFLLLSAVKTEEA